jgi:6-phosphogluconolactonase (cycloisomerase 2 family)
VLQVNGGQDLTVSVDGSFVFPVPLASGTIYTVAIKTQPAVRHEVCIATNVSGTIAAANVGNVTVNCSIFVGFVYAFDPDKSLAIYGISQTTGAPVPIGSPVSVGSNPTSVVAAPGGKFLSVASSTDNTVSVYAVDANQGALTAVGLPVATGSQPSKMVFAPSGAYLFVSNFGDSTVSTYAVDGTSGLLTSVGNALPFASGTWNSLAVTPNGKFLYVNSLLTGPGIVPTVTTVTAYAINTATGALTAGPAIQPSVDWLAMTMDPLGRFLYLDNALSSGPYMSATVLPYAIDSNTGALTAIGSGTSVGSATPNGSNGVEMVAEPSGKYLYVISNIDLSASDDNIVALAVDPTTGTLSQIGSQVALGSLPFWAVCDPSGQYLFVSNGNSAGHVGAIAANWNDVSAFTIGAIGVPAGQLSPSGQGAQFPRSVQIQYEHDTIAIVE